ncbi:hypothetical protein [Sphingomonas aerolata]
MPTLPVSNDALPILAAAPHVVMTQPREIVRGAAVDGLIASALPA